MIWVFIIVFTIIIVELAYHLPFEKPFAVLVKIYRRVIILVRARSVSDHWKEKALFAYSHCVFLATAHLAILIGIILTAFGALLVLGGLFVSGIQELMLHWTGMAASFVAASLYILLKRKFYHG